MHQASLHLHTHLFVTGNSLEKHKSEKLLDPPQRQFMSVCELEASCTDSDSGVNIAQIIVSKTGVPHPGHSRIYFAMNKLQNAMLWEWISFLKKEKKKQTMASIPVGIGLYVDGGWKRSKSEELAVK